MNRYSCILVKGVRVLARISEGACLGGIAGATAAVLTGAVAVTTAPAWLPFVGGATLITKGGLAVAGTWAAYGAAAGGALKGGAACMEEH